MTCGRRSVIQLYVILQIHQTFENANRSFAVIHDTRHEHGSNI